MANRETAPDSFAGFQNRAPADSYAAFCLTLFQNASVSWRPIFLFWLFDASRQVLPHAKQRPVLAGWFSSAGAGNIHAAADRDQNAFSTECHSSAQAFEVRHS